MGLKLSSKLYHSCILYYSLFLLLCLLPTSSYCQTDSVVKKQFDVRENLPVDESIGQVSDSPGYTYELSTDIQYFKVDQISGEVKVRSILDRESLTTTNDDRIKFIIKANSKQQQAVFYLIEVTVNVIDLNDNTPTFSSSTLNYTIAENTVTQQPFTLTANDADKGNFGSSSLKYSIVSGNDGGYWRLNSTSEAGPKHGLLYLIREVDREAIRSFQLVIKAEDGGSPSLSSSVTINVAIQDQNDNNPKFVQSVYRSSINEDHPISPNGANANRILQTQASDRDSGLNAALVYSISTSTELFTIDPLSGWIHLTKSLLNEGFNLEPENCKTDYCNSTDSLCIVGCLLEVKVKDQEGIGSNVLQDVSRVIIEIHDINDHAPTIVVNNPPIVVGEDIQKNSLVMRLEVVDLDRGPNKKVNMNITSGNELGHFSQPQCISFGAKYLCLIRTAQELDKEAVPRYNLTVKATDEGTPSLSSSLSVIVTVSDANDHAPIFQSALYTATVSELSPVNSFVAALTATDRDEGENGRVTYQISSGNNDLFFKIDEDSGLVTINRPVDSDNMTDSKLTLNVTARDHGSRPLRSEASLVIEIIDENDEVPTFSQPEYRVAIEENSPVNTTLITLTATDRDNGLNGSVRYRLSEKTNTRYPNLFFINSISGRLQVLQQLDRESVDSYEVLVVAYDLGTKITQSSETKVLVTVTDKNDNKPIFYPLNYYVEVPESASIGYLVSKVSASDLDAGDNGRVEYSIASQGITKFSVNKDTGELTVAASGLNAGDSYTILVDAKDKQGEATLSKAAVTILIANPAESDPIFTEEGGYVFSVEEDPEGEKPSIGQLVGKVTANANTVITYWLTAGDPNEVFTINQQTGQITTAKLLDREQTDPYHLTVVAKGISKLVSTSVTVNVQDVNDNRPEFDSQLYQISVNEDAPIETAVFVAQGRDKDAGIFSTLTYTLSCDKAGVFDMNRSTGAISLLQKIQLGDVISCIVTAQDGGSPPFSATTRVVFKSADVNDHSPVFQQLEYRVAVDESSMVNHRFLQVTATDEDQGENGHVTYTLSSGVSITRPEFGVFPDGSLYVAQTLDREVKDRYEVIVEASDNGSPMRRTASALVHITVVDDNDNAPVFTADDYQFKVLEGKDAGTYIGSVSARDADIGRNSDVMYFFKDKQYNFDLDPFTGEIRSHVEFDRENKSVYSLDILAVDNGMNQLSSSTNVKITVEDSNDNSPKFTKLIYEVKISEDVEPGQMIYPITATDPDRDANGLVSYQIISGNEQQKFQIDSSTGSISLKNSLSREQQAKYQLVIKAKDNGLQPKSSTATVVIRLDDANTQKPQFTQATFTENVAEDAEVGSVVAKVDAIDNDEGVNAIIEYSIVEGNNEQMFNIVAETGEIKLSKSLNYEFKQLYTLTVKASNRPPIPLSSTARVNINILDVNDNAPSFSSSPITKFIPENSDGSRIMQVVATDADSGDNGRINYAIVSQTPEEKFTIDQDGYISTTGALDRETFSSYTIVIEATDLATPASKRLQSQKEVSIIVTDLNDNSPEFVSPDAGVVMENSDAGTKVMTVSATDSDYGINATVVYTLLTETTYFTIDSTTGVITLAKAISTSPVIHSLTVRASDRGQPQRSSQQSITILLTSSVGSGLSFSQASYDRSILENVIPGSNVTSLSVNAQNVDYYVTQVISLGVVQPCFFKMADKTGQMITASKLDRDQGYEKYTVEVYVRDRSATGAPRTAKTDVQITLINVNDSPPKFDQTKYEVDITEAAKISQLVSTITANDPDSDSEVTYIITGANGKFNINNQGEIRVAEKLDRETTPTYSTVVTAFDGTYRSTTKLIINLLDTNDESPVFTRSYYSLSVSEQAVPGDAVGSVKATDNDLGEGGQVEYSLVESESSAVFSIHPQSGLITLQGALNFEQVELYILTVEAKDKGDPSLKSSATVYVNIIDENDNAPEFSRSNYTASVNENAELSYPVVTITATDKDTGLGGEVRYSIVTDDVPFVINEYNGTISVNQKLDRETIDVYTIIIKATDMDTINPMSSTSTVRVTIEDSNDQTPQFLQPLMLYVNESAAVNSVVAKLLASDGDIGINSQLTFGLLSNTDLFSVEPNSGDIKILKALDRETLSSYDLRAKVTDKGTPSLSSTALFKVIVEDANDNSPKFAAGQQTSVTLREDQAPGEVLLTFNATDADTGLASQIRYYIIAGDDNGDFHLDQLSGKLSVSRGLDYERQRAYTLTVQAEDLGQPPRYSLINVTVAVEDWNDSPPVFLHSPYYVYLQENTEIAVDLIKVQAYDADSDRYNKITYQLSFGLDDDAELSRSVFTLNSDTGLLRAVKPVDRESTPEFTFKVMAENYVSGASSLTGEATVHVIITDINDHKPEFDLPVLSASVVEGQNPGQQIIRASASDLDAGKNAEVRYKLVNATTAASVFKIDPLTGWISNNVKLDRESVDKYMLHVVAYDLGDIPQSATAEVTIYVKDLNDNSPSFMRDSYTATLRDPTNAGQFIIGTTALDPDLAENGTVTYTLIGPNTSKLSINTHTGGITAAQQLTGAQVFNVTVRAQDGRGLTTNVPLSINIANIPTSSLPTFNNPVNNITLSESQQLNVEVARVIARTSSAQGNILYSIAGGNVDNTFSIKHNGSLVLIKQLNYVVMSSYDLWIQAKDTTNGYTAYHKLEVAVIDENNHVPEFDQALYITSVVEQQTIFGSKLLLKVTANDLDSGNFGKVSYRIVSGNIDNPFYLDANDGSLKLSKQLDRETIPRYELTIEAKDGGGLTSTTIVIVNVEDINDNFPRFESSYSWTVAEDVQPGSIIASVKARDADIGVNANIVYALDRPSDKFAVSPTGNVSVKASLDRELESSYSLIISAKNVGVSNITLSGTTTVTIAVMDVNDNAPQFLPSSDYSFNFTELQAAGTVVGIINTTDADAPGLNTLVRYRFVSPSSYFLIDPITGVITSKEILKYDVTGVHNSYDLYVEAQDSGVPSRTSVASVYIVLLDANDHAPQFSRASYFSPAPKDIEIGSTLLTLSATDDLDFGVNSDITYHLVSGNGSELFGVHAVNGTVFVKSSLSALTNQYRSIVVEARDAGKPVLSSSATVSIAITPINQYTPSWVNPSSYTYNISESTSVGTEIAVVEARDADSGINSQIKYSIANGNELNIVNIDSDSGKITLTNQLDYELTKMIQMTLQAEDRALISRKEYAVLTINVKDADDNPPVFTKSMFVSTVDENLLSGTSVQRVTATDADEGANAVIRYSIIGDSSSRNYFDIDPVTGEITTKAVFDYETRSSYNLIVRATNPNSDKNAANVDVLVNVGSVNEFAPRFVSRAYVFSASESAQPGVIVNTIVAMDADEGEAGVCQYMLLADSMGKGFRLDRNTGDLIVTAELDRESNQVIKLKALVKNPGPIKGNDTDIVPIEVYLDDANDSPRFEFTQYNATVEENKPAGAFVFTAQATDIDQQADNGKFTYQLEDDHGVFSIDPQSGRITTKQSLDREAQASYAIVMQAVDKGTPPLTGQATLHVKVTDTNDQSPYFTPPIPEGEIVESASSNIPVQFLNLGLVTYDDDEPPNQGPFKYSLSSPYFTIDETTGQVFTKIAAYDYEKTKEYSLSITVSDSGGRQSQLTAKVLIRDVNDEPSTPRSVKINVYNYGKVVNGEIGTVEPNDVDTVGDYMCSLGSQQHFSIINPGCMLKAIDLRTHTSLKVNGSDGLHNTVQSSVDVNVKLLANNSLESAIVIRLSNISPALFIASKYDSFIQALNAVSSSGVSSHVIGVVQSGSSLDLYVTFERLDGTYMSTAESIISSNKNAIQSQAGVTIAAVALNVCGSNTCSNNGVCRTKVYALEELEFTSTSSLILSHNKLHHRAVCDCNSAFIGETCSEPAGACISSPCQHGATCAPVGETRYTCTCTEEWEGDNCQQDVNECQAIENPCLNGGMCINEPGGYSCKCPDNYRGPNCEEQIKCEHWNPCQNGATCQDIPTGYTCSCAFGFYGERCQYSSYGFEEASYMELSSLSTVEFDIEMTIATASENASLLLQPGVDNSQYMALQIVDGNVVFRNGKLNPGLTVSRGVSYGDWARIRATRSNAIVSLEVVYCTSPITCQNPCNKSADCYTTLELPVATTKSQRTLYVGGVPSIDVILPFSGQLSAGSFTGCIGNLKVNNEIIQLNQTLAKNVMDSCPKFTKDRADDLCEKCNDGTPSPSQCVATWFNAVCQCDGFQSDSSCSEALINKTVSLGKDSSVQYKYKESYRRAQLLAASKRKKRALLETGSRFSVSVRTGSDGDIFRTEPANVNTALSITNGYVTYSKLSNGLVKVTDGQWHDISLVISSSANILSVDGQSVSINSSALPDFLDLFQVSGLVVAENYEGCMNDLLINDEKLPMSNGYTDKYEIIVTNTESVSAGCDGCPAGVNVCEQGLTCSASGGVTQCIKQEEDKGMESWVLIVIIVMSVVFVLCLIFAAVCIVHQCRKKRKDKKTSNTGTIKSTMPIISADIRESTGDGGHDNLSERDILASERPPSARMLTPSMLNARTVPSPYQQLEDHTVIIEGSVAGTNTMNSERQQPDQFYDFDEAASIAPSDVDIRKYYKGYRKGDKENIEMSMIPKHMRPQSAKSDRTTPKPRPESRNSPHSRQYPRQSPYAYDPSRQETPISQLHSRGLRTPIDELKGRVAAQQAQRRDSESSLTDGSTIKQPHWSQPRTPVNLQSPHSMNLQSPNNMLPPGSRPTSRQNHSRPASRQQALNTISAQRQQDLNRLSNRSGSSSIDDSDDDIIRRKHQPMERNIYSEGGDSSSDESTNDSFTASEFEADEPKVRNDFQPTNMMFTKLQEVEDESDNGDPRAFRTTFAWDGLRNVGMSVNQFIHNSDSTTDLDSVGKAKLKQQPFRWDHFVSWGPNFEKLVGVFSDIAELPQENIDDIESQSKGSDVYV